MASKEKKIRITVYDVYGKQEAYDVNDFSCEELFLWLEVDEKTNMYILWKEISKFIIVELE